MPQAEKDLKTDRGFDCPYCGMAVKSGDRHAIRIDKRNLKGAPTITVTCEIVRTYAVSLSEPVEG